MNNMKPKVMTTKEFIKVSIVFIICYVLGSCDTTEIKENNTVQEIVDTTACCSEENYICKDLLHKLENDIPIGH